LELCSGEPLDDSQRSTALYKAVSGPSALLEHDAEEVDILKFYLVLSRHEHLTTGNVPAARLDGEGLRLHFNLQGMIHSVEFFLVDGKCQKVKIFRPRR
jgi:hypothetical protein